MVMAGFLGVMIIIRLGLQAFNWGVVFALLSGLCSACYYLMTSTPGAGAWHCHHFPDERDRRHSAQPQAMLWQWNPRMRTFGC